MKVLTTKNEGKSLITMAQPCGYRINSLTIYSKDAFILSNLSDEQKLEWINLWIVRFPPHSVN